MKTILAILASSALLATVASAHPERETIRRVEGRARCGERVFGIHEVIGHARFCEPVVDCVTYRPVVCEPVIERRVCETVVVEPRVCETVVEPRIVLGGCLHERAREYGRGHECEHIREFGRGHEVGRGREHPLSR